MVYLCHRILCHLKKRPRALLIALEIQWGIIEVEEKQDAEKFQLYYPIFINQSKKKVHICIFECVCETWCLYINMEKHGPSMFLGEWLGEGYPVIFMSIEKREGDSKQKMKV